MKSKLERYNWLLRPNIVQMYLNLDDSYWFKEANGLICPSHASHTTKKFEKAKLLTRGRSEDDTRINLCHFTKKGKLLKEQLSKLVGALE